MLVHDKEVPPSGSIERGSQNNRPLGSYKITNGTTLFY